ncbi:MAG: hypothetical protein K0V04_16190 [Deltaproteobacteria bacterium]|nr:hypothetical protein [Deltaproteobacteria bacterium]
MVSKAGVAVVGLMISSGCAARPAPAVGMLPGAQPAPVTKPAKGIPLAHDSDDEVATEVIDQIEQATRVWRGSCPQTNPYGLCVQFVAAASGAEGCGERQLGVVVVLERETETAAAAQADLAAAMERVGCRSEISCNPELLAVEPDDPEVRRRFRRALAAARLARADAELEAYFGLALPHEPHTTSAKPARSKDAATAARDVAAMGARLETFMADKRRASEALVTQLVLIKEYRDSEAVLHAALRASWVALHWSDELIAAAVPTAAADDASRRAYCEGMAGAAANIRQVGVEAAHYCTMRASESQSDSEVARACRELHGRIAP